MVGPRVGGGDVGSGGEFRVAGSWGGGAQVMVVVNGEGGPKGGRV